MNHCQGLDAKDWDRDSRFFVFIIGWRWRFSFAGRCRRVDFGLFWLEYMADSGRLSRAETVPPGIENGETELALVHQLAHVSQQVIFVHRTVILHGRCVFIKIDQPLDRHFCLQNRGKLVLRIGSRTPLD